MPTGAFPTGDPPAGWTAWYENGSPHAGMFIGVLNPGTSADHAPDPACFPDGAPEGDNVVLLYQDGDTGGDEYGVEQDLGIGLQPHTAYTLSVEVGNIASCAGLVSPYDDHFELGGFPGYRVQLLAGGVVLEEDAGLLTLGEGEFGLTTLRHETSAAPPVGNLSVRLVNRNQPDEVGVDGLEVDFDAVQLVAVPVPLAGWTGGALAMTLLLGGARRLQDRRIC